MALLQSGTRIYGNSTIDTSLVVGTGASGNIASISTGSGTITVVGGIGVTGNIYSGANVNSLNANLGNLVTANYFSGTLTTNSQPNITSVGTLTELNVNGNTTITGNLYVSGNVAYVNSTVLDIEDPLLFLGGNANNSTLTANDGFDRGTILRYYSSGSEVSAFMGWKNANSDFEFASNSTVTNGIVTINTLANVVANNFTGNVIGYAQTISNASQPNITSVGTLTNLTVSGTITGTLATNAQPNITSVGNLTTLYVTGVTNLGNVGNVKIIGGTTGQYLSTDGTGNLSWINTVTLAGSNTQVQFNNNGSLGASANFSFDKTTNTLSVTSIIAEGGNVSNIQAGNIVGTIANANYAAYAGNVTLAAQSNITSVGTLGNLSVTSNITAGNANLGNAVIANYFIGNGNNLSNIQGSNVSGQVNYANVANNVAGANVSGQVNYANVANNVAGANVSDQVANALIAGTVYTNAQPNITSVGNLSGLSVTGNITSTNANLGNLATANYFSGDGYLLSNVTVSSTSNITVTGNANIANLNVTNNANLGSVANVKVTGGTSGYVLTTDGTGNLSWSSPSSQTGISIISNIASLIAGDALTISTDYSNASYPGGIFTIDQLGPVTLSVSDQWSQSGSNIGTTKNAYANYIAGTTNTANVKLSLNLGNALFNVQSSDYINIGSSNITGANLLALNITGTGGTYTIPSGYLTVANTQTNATDTVSVSLTANRGVSYGTGTTLINNQPVAFNVTALSGSFSVSSVPYFSINQGFNWAATVTGTASAGNVTYTQVANSLITGTLTTSGGLSGTSVTSLDSTQSYTISSSDYYGNGLYGAGQRTIPSTVTGTVSAASMYYPLFYKITSSSSNPTFTTSDSHLSNNYATGQGATTSSSTSQYLWIAIPGSASHTFAYTFLGSQVGQNPAQTYTGQTISGYTYNVYGFTNFSVATLVYTVT